MKASYQITEYGSFIAEKEIPGYTPLPRHTFEQLEKFILTNKSKDADALELMGISARKGAGKVITARNYVGVITMTDGTTIEILPKIYSPEKASEQRVKKLFADMLKTLRVSPYKTLQISNVNIETMNIFEIFIRMFVDEVFQIVKRGLKCDYITVENNEEIFRGKLLFSEHIKRNYCHKERSYVEFDEYNSNRPENRLIKSTLKYLYRQSSSVKNKSSIKTLLNEFCDVDVSLDHEGDYSKFIPGRNMADYQTALLWCRVFLTGKSFTSFSGSEIAAALLFPMERLFESYAASKLKKALGTADYIVSVQDKSCYLFDEPGKKFLIKPDIAVKRKEDNAVFIMDTKWKLLSENKANYGISQSDMYQMYAYQKKYNARNVTVLYPLTDLAVPDRQIMYKSGDGADIRVQFLDLFNIEKSLGNVIEKSFIS